MTATHQGKEYRVIYNADGDLWARDVIANPPKARKRRVKKPSQYKLTTFQVNAETAVMVYKIGIEQTALHYGVTYGAIVSRVRRLENRLGYRIFPKHGYSLLTHMGKQFMKWHSNGSTEAS